MMNMLRKLSGIAAAALRLLIKRASEEGWPSIGDIAAPDTASVTPVRRSLLERDSRRGTLSRADGSPARLGQ